MTDLGSYKWTEVPIFLIFYDKLYLSLLSEETMKVEWADAACKTPFTFQELKNPELMNYAKEHLSFQGVAKVDPKTPYSYLKVGDDFIHQLFPLLKKDHPEAKMLDYFSAKQPVGAHVTIAYSDERYAQAIKDKILSSATELQFQFESAGLFKVAVFGKTIFALAVSSPGLTEFRLQEKLSEKLNYHGLLVPFHITIGIY